MTIVISYYRTPLSKNLIKMLYNYDIPNLPPSLHKCVEENSSIYVELYLPTDYLIALYQRGFDFPLRLIALNATEY